LEATFCNKRVADAHVFLPALTSGYPAFHAWHRAAERLPLMAFSTHPVRSPRLSSQLVWRDGNGIQLPPCGGGKHRRRVEPPASSHGRERLKRPIKGHPKL